MSCHAMTAWLFGKLPVHGDFVSRGLPMQEREMLDSWLSAEMAQAKAKLGDDFADSYDAAPPWCFVRKNDNDNWAGGALCPSMDSAGRRFPILVARANLSAEEATVAARSCVDLIYDAFATSMTADALLAATEAFRPDTNPGTSSESWWVEDEAQEPVIRLAGKFPPGLIAAMLEGASP
jgi:type VI secretion system protein ImpM